MILVRENGKSLGKVREKGYEHLADAMLFQSKIMNRWKLTTRFPGTLSIFTYKPPDVRHLPQNFVIVPGHLSPKLYTYLWHPGVATQ